MVIALPHGEAAFRRNRAMHVRWARAWPRRAIMDMTAHIGAAVTIDPTIIGHRILRRGRWRRRCRLFLICVVRGRFPSLVPAMMPMLRPALVHHSVMRRRMMMMGRRRAMRTGRLLRRCRLCGRGMGGRVRMGRSQRNGERGGGGEKQGFHLNHPFGTTYAADSPWVRPILISG